MQLFNFEIGFFNSKIEILYRFIYSGSNKKGEIFCVCTNCFMPYSGNLQQTNLFINKFSIPTENGCVSRGWWPKCRGRK